MNFRELKKMLTYSKTALPNHCLNIPKSKHLIEGIAVVENLVKRYDKDMTYWLTEVDLDNPNNTDLWICIVITLKARPPYDVQLCVTNGSEFHTVSHDPNYTTLSLERDWRGLLRTRDIQVAIKQAITKAGQGNILP